MANHRHPQHAENRGLHAEVVGMRVKAEPRRKANRRTTLVVATVILLALLAIPRLEGAFPETGRPQGVMSYAILPTRSTVRFDARATGHTVHGISHQVSGKVIFDPENLSREAEVSFKVESVTLDTGNKSRDKKMRESHLDTARYPVIAFHSSKVAAIAPTLRAEETQEMQVTGTLALHGTEKQISFPVKAVRHGEELVVTGETSLKMTDYGIPIPGFLFMKVKDEVKVMFEVVAKPSQGGN
jgi:polyisoprenoid-binding protein YceI